jgi:hypothetical protein
MAFSAKRSVTPEELERHGAPPELVETLRALLQREPRAVAVPCTACGRRGSLADDYLCGSCSTLKAKDERKFWRQVNESGRAGMFPVSGPIVMRDDREGEDDE